MYFSLFLSQMPKVTIEMVRSSQYFLLETSRKIRQLCKLFASPKQRQRNLFIFSSSQLFNFHTRQFLETFDKLWNMFNKNVTPMNFWINRSIKHWETNHIDCRRGFKNRKGLTNIGLISFRDYWNNCGKNFFKNLLKEYCELRMIYSSFESCIIQFQFCLGSPQSLCDSFFRLLVSFSGNTASTPCCLSGACSNIGILLGT